LKKRPIRVRSRVLLGYATAIALSVLVGAAAMALFSQSIGALDGLLSRSLAELRVADALAREFSSFRVDAQAYLGSFDRKWLDAAEADSAAFLKRVNDTIELARSSDATDRAESLRSASDTFVSTFDRLAADAQELSGPVRADIKRSTETILFEAEKARRDGLVGPGELAAFARAIAALGEFMQSGSPDDAYRASKALEESRALADAPSPLAARSYETFTRAFQRAKALVEGITTGEAELLGAGERVFTEIASLQGAIEARVRLEGYWLKAFFYGAMTLVGALTAVAALAGSAIAGRSAAKITKPLEAIARAAATLTDEDLPALTESLRALARGEARVRLEVRSEPLAIEADEEVATTVRAFNEIATLFKEAEGTFAEAARYIEGLVAATAAIARGDLSIAVDPASEGDRLGQAIASMLEGLRASKAETEQRAARLLALHDVDLVVTGKPDLGRVADVIVESAISLLSLDAARLVFDTGEGRMQRGRGFPTGFAPPPSREVIATGTGSDAAPEGWSSYYSFPLVSQGESFGALEAGAIRPKALDYDGLAFLSTLAGQAAIAAASYSLLEGLEEEVAARTAELQVAKAKAEDATRAKSEFLASMSHEIRTPMNAVIGYAELLVEAGLERKEREWASKALSAAKGLLRIVNDVLDLSRVEAGKLELRNESFDPREALYGTADMLAPKAAATGVELVVDVSDQVPMRLLGDSLRFSQIALNLIGNAVKFTERGEVVVRLERGDGYAPPGDGGSWGFPLRLRVRDTGIGIAAEALESIFAPFEQADVSVAKRFGGSGLGLAISRRIAALMGGTVRATSEEGKGSEFFFEASLPAAPLPDGAEEQTLPERYRGARALIVDDNAAALEAATGAIRALGFEALSARDADAALAELELGAPLVAILDRSLDGAERLARAIGGRCALVLLTEAGKDGGVLPRGLASNAPSITKPASKKALYDAVAEALRFGAKPEGGAAPEDDGALRGARILVVDDEPLNRELAAELLARFGAACDFAENGTEAVAKAVGSLDGGRIYDAILMDALLPDFDGFEATRRIIACMGDRAPPVIALSAGSEDDTKRRAVEAGMADSIGKPIDRASFAATLRRHLRRTQGPGRVGRGPLHGEPSIGAPGLASHDGQAAPIADPGTRTKGQGFPDSMPGLDIARLRERLGLPDESLAELFRPFIERHAATVDALPKAISEDRQAARKLAHSLRGLSGNVGAFELAELASALENAIVAGDDAAAGTLAEKTARSLAAALDSLYALLSGENGGSLKGGSAPSKGSERTGGSIADSLREIAAMARRGALETLGAVRELYAAHGGEGFDGEAARLLEAAKRYDFEATARIADEIADGLG
jgi:signal transduction histidine kinase/DNA-binding response OmpR family regulator/HPt (histidine-containing phosphotransfer) domain-containing protein